MSNLIKLVFAAAALLFSLNVFASPGSRHTCAKGQTMVGNITDNNVRCDTGVKKLKNPGCGVKRYRVDADGIKDRCVRKNRPNDRGFWKRPRCAKGVYSAVSGYDGCRSGRRLSRPFYCKRGWTMTGSTSRKGGRGVILCVQTRRLSNKPDCGVKRYRVDADGIKDRCVRKNRPNMRGKWTQPRCIGGFYTAVSGYDICRSGYKRRHPWKMR